MRAEIYTLPVIALLTFVSVSSAHIYALKEVNQISIVKSDTTKTELKNDIFSSQAASAASSIVRDSTLAALYSFDEGEGVTLLDRSQYGAAGVVHGNPTWDEGVEGSSLYFDGVDDYVDIKDNPVISDSQSFTLASWVMPDEFSGGTVLSNGGEKDFTENSYVLAVSDGRMLFGVNSNITLLAGATDIKPQQWSYTTVTYDKESSPNVKLYVNGQHVLSSNVHPLQANTASLLIGRNFDGDYFKGRIDEVRVYSEALSGKEISNLYDTGNAQIVAHQQDEESSASADDTDNYFFTLFQKFINYFDKK